MKRALLWPWLMTISLALLRAGGSVAAPTERASFLMISRADTILLDHFTRNAEGMEGQMMAKGHTRQVYAMRFGPKAAVKGTRVGLYAPSGSTTDTLVRQVTSRHGGDTIFVQVNEGDVRYDYLYEMPRNGLIGVTGSAAFLEHLIRRARAVGGAKREFTVFLPETRQGWKATVSRIGRDSTKLVLAGEEWRFATDAEGRILGGRGVTNAIDVRRIPYGGRR